MLFPIFGTYLLLYLAFWDRFPLHRVMRFGDLSYGTYLYAFPIQQLLVQYLHLRNSPVRLFAAATPLVLAAAAASWFFVERPALRWGKRRHPLQNTSGVDSRTMIPVSAD